MMNVYAIEDEPMYMHTQTGSVDTYDGWWYETLEGETRNAVDDGLWMVKVIKDANGNWVEADE